MLGRNLLAVLLAAALAVGLAACDDDSETGGPTTAATATATASSTTVTTAPTSEEAYAEGLRDAAGALTDLGGAVVSGDEPQAVQDAIASALDEWQDAIDRAGAADLDDPTLVGQRDDLEAASPDFVSAWTAVGDQWATGRANGLLELAQQRAPIVGGAQALAGAIDGALSTAGEEAQSRLEGLRDEVTSALEQIQSP